MMSGSLPSDGEIVSAMTPSYLRPLGIIHVAISMAPIFFAAAIVFVMLTMPPLVATPSDISLIDVLSILNLVILASAWFVGSFIFQKMVASGISSEIAGNDQTLRAEVILAALKSGLIVRLAMLEGSAVFGLTVCLLGVMRGVLPGESIYWFNLVPITFLIAYSVSNFPSSGRILSILKEFQ